MGRRVFRTETTRCVIYYWINNTTVLMSSKYLRVPFKVCEERRVSRRIILALCKILLILRITA